MKVIKLNDLTNPEHKAPFYAVIDETKKGTADARACGCASLAMLNMILVLKHRLDIDDDLTALDEMRWIQEQTQEKDNAVQPDILMEFIDTHPLFNSCRMLVMNPNGMNEEIFLRIFLRRLAGGDLVLALMETPDKNGEPAKDILNHASFVHSENGEVYFDGLRVDLNFLLRAFYFSKPTTLIFFAVNPGGKNGR
jgi:hypothetical protein